MRKGTKIFLFIALGILCTGVIISIIAFALNGFRIRNTASAGEAPRFEKHVIEGTIEASAKAIEIEVISDDLRILKSADGSSHWKYEGPLSEEDFDITSDVDSFKLKQLASANLTDWRSLEKVLDNLASLTDRWFRSFPADLDGTLTLYLSEKEYEEWNFSSVSGSIFADPGLSVKEASLAAVSGDIRIEKLDGLDRLNISTVSGTITASESAASSGIFFATTSGEISAVQMSTEKKAAFSTVSGSILLKDSSFKETEIETASGEIFLDRLQSEKLEAETISGDVTGKIDADARVLVTTVSGDTSVPSGTKGDWKIHTTSGDVFLEGIEAGGTDKLSGETVIS